MPPGRSARALALAVVAASSLSLLPATTAAASHGGGPTCAAPVPIADVRAGMTGTGYTVTEGRTPSRFGVEVLGVMEDAVAPGRDVIIARVSGAPIDVGGGGIWFGISGSPVYVGDRLLGAVAYGMSASPSPIAGITPAQGILDIAALGAGEDVDADTVRLSAAVQADVADELGVEASQVGSQLDRLPVPLAISGVSASRLAALREVAAATGRSFIPVGGGAPSAAQAASTATPHLAPGDNFAAALSYGDITAAGIGTTSYFCEDTVVAFGHPMVFTGETLMGISEAEALAIVVDTTFGPYKLATVGAPIGTLTQDRMTGIAGVLGPVPEGLPVTSTVTSVELDRSRDGRTDVIHPTEYPFLALNHLLGNIDSVTDRLGKGSSQLSFTVEGRDADGQPWAIDRDNRFASNFDIAFDSVFELLAYLQIIENNPVEEVEVTAIDIDATVRATEERSTIAAVELIADDGSAMPVPPELSVEPGQTLRVRVSLGAFRSRDVETVDLTLEVPEDAAIEFGGSLEVTGGGVGSIPLECMFDPTFCPGAGAGFTDFDQILDVLRQQPRNDEVVATLRFAPPLPTEPIPGSLVSGPLVGQEPVPPLDPSGGTVVQSRAQLDRVVTGAFVYPLLPSFGGAGIERIAGGNRFETSVAVSQATFAGPGSASAVVIARGDDHADALTAAPLAAREGGPVLLSPRSGLPAVVRDEVARLGAERAFVLGGTAALSPQVEDDLRSAGVSEVVRIAGSDRYDTARRVAERLDGPRVYLVRGTADGRGWADAIAASGVASSEQAAILLTEPGRLPAATRQVLDAQDGVEVVVVGGERVIGPSVVAAVEATAGPTVRRIAGGDRYATSQALARFAVDGGADPRTSVLATGRSFADGLSAGPLAASRGGVLLLVDGTDAHGSPGVDGWLREHADAPQWVALVGGYQAISPEVEARIAEAVFGMPAGMPTEPIPVDPVGNPIG